MSDLLATARAWTAAGERVVMATVVRVDGSAPQGEGAKMLVAASGPQPVGRRPARTASRIRIPP